MSLIRMFTPRPCGIPCVVFIGSLVGALCAPIESAVSMEREEALTRLKAQYPGVRVYTVDDQISRVYGRPFSTGETPQASAERFRQLHSTLWGVPVQDLNATGPFADGRHVQPIMFNQDTGQYKFTGLYYTQQRDGVDVFRSRLTLLVRNADDYPLVLASADLRDLGGFRVPRAAIEDRNPSRALTLAKKRYGNDAMITRQKLVIWAGVNNVPEAPTLAEESVVEFGADAWLLLTDAATGRFVYEEHLIHFGEVSGNASGLSTEGIGADQCEAEVSKPLPYLTVTSGTNATFTDVNGDFTLPGGGGNISALLSGQWFSVTNAAGTNSSESVPAVSPANLVFNSTNGSQQARSQVNAYVEANVVRDFALVYNPSYPSLDIGDFTVVVNRTDGFCPGNAWYSSALNSINFCLSSSSPPRPNTAWSSVVYHEYGHHLVQSAGSGQDEYGEGMSDCVSVLILDSPFVGWGFFGDCSSSLRTADNTCQYLPASCSSCGDVSHTCGQLIAGCIWSTRNELAVSHPSTYRDILSNLTINSILLHTGTTIRPDITVDFLTLDDDDGDLGNGTPHYDEINVGFSAHNMDPPPLELLAFSYPNGRPEFVSPDGMTLPVAVSSNVQPPQAGTGVFHLDSGSGFVEISMTESSPNVYEAEFPPSPCGTTFHYYFSAETSQGDQSQSPTTAPTKFFTAYSGFGRGDLTFVDDFQSDFGWSIQNSGITAGQWERATPDTACVRGNPLSDGDGSGLCYLTQNVGGPSGDPCNTDVDGGITVLTSPTMDASEPSLISYWRWYSNSTGASPEADEFLVEISDDNGTTWSTLEVVGPNAISPNPEVDGGWFNKKYSLSGVAGFELNNQFKVRFTAGDVGSGSIVEAGIDGVMLQRILCQPPCAADITGDNQVNVDDLLNVINNWGSCKGCPADITGDNVVNVDDLLAIINTWGPCP